MACKWQVHCLSTSETLTVSVSMLPAHTFKTSTANTGSIAGILEARRLTADLIFCYKIINGLVTLDPADFFVFRDSKTRGHKHKLVVQHSRVDARQHFFVQ